MVIIGLISDTHGYFDPAIKTHFEDCHAIWHAGDIGENNVLDQLKELKPTLAVYGNIDSKEMQWQLPENEFIELEGLRFLLTHIAGTPPKYNKRIKELLKTQAVDVIICGHSHRETIKKDRENNIVFLNPGAAGKQGFHTKRHLMKMHLFDKKIVNLEIIPLGGR